MTGVNSRRDRLEQLLGLAQTYRGWTRRQLAKELGRDTTKLVPDSGLPKLDLLMDLARVLDWPVEDVAGHIWLEEPVATIEGEETSLFANLESESQDAHRAGRFSDAVRTAEQAFRVANEAEDRAIACTRLASAWDGMGRYTQAIDATRQGLLEEDISPNRRLILQSNLAAEYYTLWHLLEAKSIAQDLILTFTDPRPQDRVNRETEAFAYYVRGHSFRRMMELNRKSPALAEKAVADLTVSTDLYHRLAEECGDEYLRGIANTCVGGRLEAEVELGRRQPESVLAEYTQSLEELIDLKDVSSGDWLESYGWWCIFGCNVALRHVSDPRDMQKHMALFTNKADQIAERLDNWSLRERVFSMDYTRRQRFADWTGVEAEWTIDKEDVRLLAGTMGRFPGFRPTGWRILRSAKVVVDN